MDDPRTDAARLQETTRWLLVVLVGACVLAAGVLAVSDVPGLVGRRWQVVGAVSAAVTVLALVIGLLAVLRAMGPQGDDDVAEPASSGAAPVVAEAPVLVDEVDADEAVAPVADPDAGTDNAEAVAVTSTTVASSPTAADTEPAALVLPPSAPGAEARRAHRAHRQAVRRYHRARSIVTVAVVVALLGMVGMATAAVVDGNNVEDRTRTQLEAQLTAQEDGPITEPQAVAVQLTTPGLRRVAEAMGCTGGTIGARPVQGWAVSGTYRNPTVVLFAPAPGCRNIEIALAPRDGFVYPTLQSPATSTARPSVTPTSVAGGQGAGAGAGGQGAVQAQGAATSPTTAAG